MRIERELLPRYPHGSGCTVQRAQSPVLRQRGIQMGRLSLFSPSSCDHFMMCARNVIIMTLQKM